MDEVHSNLGEDFPFTQSHFNHTSFKKLDESNSIEAIKGCFYIKWVQVYNNHTLFYTFSENFHKFCEKVKLRSSFIDALPEEKNEHNFKKLQSEIQKGKYETLRTLFL